MALSEGTASAWTRKEADELYAIQEAELDLSSVMKFQVIEW